MKGARMSRAKEKSRWRPAGTLPAGDLKGPEGVRDGAGTEAQMGGSCRRSYKGPEGAWEWCCALEMPPTL